MRRLLFLPLIASSLCHSNLAGATETITYSYDALGRIVQVSHSGTVNDGVVTTYSYDSADNRKQVITTGASH